MKQEKDLRTEIAEGGKTNVKETLLMFGGFSVAAFGWYLMTNFSNLVCITGIVLLVIGLSFGAQAMLRRKKARESMKQRLSETIIPELLSEVFDEVEYDHRGFIDGALIVSIDMHFPFKYDAVIGSDHIRARYRGVDIEMSDILLDSVAVLTSEDDDGNIETHEVHRNRFRGQWIILDMHRELTSDLCIFEDGRKKKGQVETENEAFNSMMDSAGSTAEDVGRQVMDELKNQHEKYNNRKK